MNVEISRPERLAQGTRVARTAAPEIRGTVMSGPADRLQHVRVDDGGSHSGPAHHRTWRPLTTEELEAEAREAAAPEPELVPGVPFSELSPCTCGQGYAQVQGCPDCSANLRLARAGQPHGYRLAGAPTDAERRAALEREERKLYPGHIDGAVQVLMRRARRSGFTSYGCTWCGATAAADNPSELVALLEHTAFDHSAGAELEAHRAPVQVWSADQLRRAAGWTR